ARRLIKGGGGRLNDAKIDDENTAIGSGDLKDGVIKLSAGKKRHALVRAV
ncbi:MAG TPA: tyrosine--tRNA ligase, partial [Rhodospirillaceae bacterium]|nr:tyrosine--tRNA ligase [Rhodospirillaceae bacterium]